MLFYQILANEIDGKVYKSHIRTINLKYQLQHDMKNLNYLMYHILYQKIKIMLNVEKNHGEKTVKPSIRIYMNDIESRITSEI